LPSAAVFLLLLCNDKEVVGPWINSRKTNIFTSGVISLLIMLSIILTASVLYPSIGAGNIVAILIGGSAATTIIGLVVLIRHRKPVTQVTMSRTEKLAWRMPPLVTLTKPVISYSRRVWLGVLRGYLLVATILVIIRVVQLIYSK
jgi:hypothetical protein